MLILNSYNVLSWLVTSSDKELMKNNFTQCLNQISFLHDGHEIKYEINEKDDFLMLLLKWCKGIRMKV